MFGLLAAAHEFVHWAAAALCIAGSVVAWFRLPIFGKYIGAGLLAMAAGLIAYDMGFRARGELDQSAALRAEIAARDAVIVEKDRQAQAAHEIAKAASDRASASEALSANLQSEIDAYADELAKRPADSRCALDERDVRGLQSIGKPAARAPQPPRRPATIR